MTAQKKYQLLLRYFFRTFNRLFMVPAFRLGLGLFIANPITGYVMVLKTRGRRTGKVRYTPLNYALVDGKVYCLRGRHLQGRWYLNIKSEPSVEVILPGGCHISGVAEDVRDQGIASSALRQILKGSGLGGFVYGFNPHTADDTIVRKKTEGISVICITPNGVYGGAGDFGGWFWLIALSFFAIVVLMILRWTKAY